MGTHHDAVPREEEAAVVAAAARVFRTGRGGEAEATAAS